MFLSLIPLAHWLKKTDSKMADKRLWTERAQALKNKRQGGSTKNAKSDPGAGLGSNIVSEGEFVVQLLASKPTGDAMKYKKKDSKEFVNFPFNSMSIENLIDACTSHFRHQLKENEKCDILQGQNGPSCTKITQIKDFKTIFVRFVPMTPSISIGKYFDKMPSRPKPYESKKDLSSSALPTLSKALSPRPPPVSYPKSLSITDMMKFGTAISSMAKPPVTIEIQEINLVNKEWSFPIIQKFDLSETPLTKGGFREVFEATNQSSKEKFVVKTFLPQVLTTMEEVNKVVCEKETKETLAKKAIQTHALAKNIASSLKKLCIKKNVAGDFGEFFEYNRAYFGTMVKANGEKDCVMVEEFVDGEFVKFINNDGKILHGDASNLERELKAQCLAHYSHVKSNEKFMLVDIQGSGYKLYDPEIATSSNAIQQSRLNFNLGNLSKAAIDMFMEGHVCNRFCKMIGLKQPPHSNVSLFL
ncbi:myosin heavy chain kinase A-like [Clytia hemisphaerica]|uniref:myosin heavy chain kinase A-like n=1 Tax=Clytia hemisphaerica TaxID=252671 RepID=UPI0034D74DD2